VRDQANDRQVVADEQVRQAELALQRDHQVQDLALDEDVEGADGLIHDDQLGAKRQGAGDRDPLALATREFVRPAMFE